MIENKVDRANMGKQMPRISSEKREGKDKIKEVLLKKFSYFGIQQLARRHIMKM